MKDSSAHNAVSWIEKLPRQTLGFFPTPVVELSRLSDFLNGPRILMKRDDLSGLALGGNKTRKLEFLIGDALAHAADVVITGGAQQSNHCRQTAAAAAVCGLECHLALGGDAPQAAMGNLLLDQLLGAHIHWSETLRKGENIPAICAQLVQEGKRPYVIPYGGSNPLGAVAFIEALRELDAQSEMPHHIVFASSSGGTHAGLMLGRRILQRSVQIIGVAIDKEGRGDMPFDQHVWDLTCESAAAFGLTSPSFGELDLRNDYVGEGYGKVGALEIEAIELTAQLEGILLDPVYTGRAMGALIDMIRRGEFSKNETVLFWHTGGAPALFAYEPQIRAFLRPPPG